MLFYYVYVDNTLCLGYMTISLGWRVTQTLLRGIPATSRDVRINSSSSQEITGSSPMDYLGSLESRGFQSRGAQVSLHLMNCSSITKFNLFSLSNIVLTFLGRHCNVLPILTVTETEQERFDQISSTLEQG